MVPAGNLRRSRRSARPPSRLKARPALAAEYQKALSILVRDVSEWMAISSACSRGNVKKQSASRGTETHQVLKVLLHFFALFPARLHKHEPGLESLHRERVPLVARMAPHQPIS